MAGSTLAFLMRQLRIISNWQDSRALHAPGAITDLRVTGAESNVRDSSFVAAKILEVCCKAAGHPELIDDHASIPAESSEELQRVG